MTPRAFPAVVVLGLALAACGSGQSSSGGGTSTEHTAEVAQPPKATAPASEPPRLNPTDTPAAPSTPVGAAPAGPAGPEAGGDATSAPASAPTPTQPGSCAAPQRLPIQGGEHLIGDNPPPVPYSSSPPTSGWHASGAFDLGVRPVDQPLSEPRQVSVLEAGGVVVTYNGLDEATRATLEQHVREHLDGRVAVTPYEPLDAGAVAFAAWGLLQRCDGLDLAALDAFVTAHADTDVSPGHAH